MQSSQLLDYRRLQGVVCGILQQQQQEDANNYYRKDNDIIPAGDIQFNIGSSNARFNNLYLGGDTIYMGDASKTQLHANRCNVFWAIPGMGAPFFEFMNSNYPGVTEGPNSGLHVYYNVQCNDLWKIYPDGTDGPFATARGPTGPQGPPWQFSNDLVPLTPGLNIGTSSSNVNTVYTTTVQLNGTPVTVSGGSLTVNGIGVPTQTDFTAGVSTLSTIISYGLSSIQTAFVGVSTLSSIVSYGLSTVASQPTPGVSSLSSIISYGLSSVQTGPFGGLLRVDCNYGNDTYALNNKYQYAFKTIGAAMNAANGSANDCIQVLPGTYNEAVVFKAGVNLRGVSLNSVIIQQLNVTSNTTLITLASNTRLEDVTLKLTSTNGNAANLVGVLFSNVQGTAKIRSITTIFDNSAIGTDTATNIYGIYSTGSSSTAISSFDEIQRMTINVTSSGRGQKRGIYVDGSNSFHCRDINIYCKDNPAYPSYSNGSYIGAETNHPNAVLQIKTSTSYGFAAVPGNTSADISQTQGQIILAYTDLPNRNANGYSLIANQAQNTITFSISGSPSGFRNTYMIPGSLVGGNNDINTYYPLKVATISLLDQISFQCQSFTVGGPVSVYLFKNSNIQPNFTLSLSINSNTFVKTSNVSLTLLPTDNFSIMLSNASGNFGAGDLKYPLVTLSFY